MHVLSQTGLHIESEETRFRRDQQTGLIQPAGGGNVLFKGPSPVVAIFASVEAMPDDVEPEELFADRMPERTFPEDAGGVVPDL